MLPLLFLQALQLEIEDLKSDIEHYKGINVMLKKLIKEEQLYSEVGSLETSVCSSCTVW